MVLKTGKCLLLFFLHQIFLSWAKEGYILTGPKILNPGNVENFCVSIEGAEEWSSSCTLDLLNADDDSVYSTTSNSFKGPKGCINLKVPIEIKEENARLRFRMEIDGPSNYKIDNTKEVHIKRVEKIQLIQTDKAWYTPGQLVRFRILNLDRLLRPILEPVQRIWVEDPTGTTISQWTNLTTTHGIHQIELQLSVEPVQGFWKIRTKEKSQEFEVREFVLPKFEMILKSPTSVNFNHKEDNTPQKLNFGICAKYSYGQPLRGKWKAIVQVKNERRYSWAGQVLPKDVNFEREGELDSDNGCHVLEIASDQLGISTYNFNIIKTITVTAFVIEQGTGIELNSTWSSEVMEQTFTIQIESWTGSTFKNGLPYYGHAKLSSSNGRLVNGTTLEICVQIKNKNDSWGIESERCAHRVVDSNGIANFKFLPSIETEHQEYRIKAAMYKGHVEVLNEKSVIQRSYSPSGSYIAFVPPPNYLNAVSCRSKLPVKVYFTADNEANFNLHYTVMARGQVMTTGVKQVKFFEKDKIDMSLEDDLIDKRTSAKSLNILVGAFEFEIEIPAEFAPKMSLLAYYVRNDQEVVAASMDIPVQNCFPNPVELTWSSKRKQPGQEVTMNLKSGSGSICGYSVVDRSVTFNRPDLQLNESNVYANLPNLHIAAGSHPAQTTPDTEYCPSESPVSGESKEVIRYKTEDKDAMADFDVSRIINKLTPKI